jgi:hypothetical protein
VKFGDPRLPGKVWQRTVVNPLSGCWEWTGKTRNGYGRITRDGREVSVYRWALEAELGRPIGPGLDGRHLCHNRGCLNPNPGHVCEGTRRQNMDDSRQDGRLRRGSATPGARFTERQVLWIRWALDIGVPGQDLARALGCSPMAVSRIRTGHTWSHVPDLPPDRWLAASPGR